MDAFIDIARFGLFVIYGILGLLYIVGVFLVCLYQWQREGIIDNLEVKCKSEYAAQTKAFAEGRSNELREKARPRLEKLERKQKFLLSILPFVWKGQ